jgi:hypothetical protein
MLEKDTVRLKKKVNYLFCNILENINPSERARVKGDISCDPVYLFLIDVQKDLETIASSQYERSPDHHEFDSGGQDFDIYLDQKQSFLDSLIDSITSRGGVEETLPSRWSKATVINTSERYNYLLGLANLPEPEKKSSNTKFCKGNAFLSVG